MDAMVCQLRNPLWALSFVYDSPMKVVEGARSRKVEKNLNAYEYILVRDDVMPNDPHHVVHPLYYSTDLNKAMELWNTRWKVSSTKMWGGAGTLWRIEKTKQGIGLDGYPEWEDEFVTEAPTPALAIVRAYLIEKMKEDKSETR